MSGVKRIDHHGQSSIILVSGVMVPFIVKLRVHGVNLDSHLSFDEHITGVVTIESSATHPGVRSDGTIHCEATSARS